LDGVYQAFQKLGAAEALHLFWTDQLRSNTFDEKYRGVSHLNSIKAPVVQVCKEALEGDDGSLSSLNDFTTVLKGIKRTALEKMIAIKAREVENLQNFVQSHAIAERLRLAWKQVVTKQTGHITPEHAQLLGSGDAIQRVARVAASIGESSYQRTRLAKQKKRVEPKKNADVEMTDVSSTEGKKHLATLVKEQFQRELQSRQDRARSGKGKRSSGISKKKKTQKKKEQTKKKNKSGGAKPKGVSKQTPNAKRRERR
jgi:hypothetical protein